MTKVSSERMSQVLKPRRLPNWTITLWLSHLFFCACIPCWPWKRHIWNILGRKRWELGSWILIWFLPLITSDFLAITSSIQMQCPLPWIRALHVEALRMNFLIFQHQCSRDEENQIIIIAFAVWWHSSACLLSGDCNWKGKCYPHLYMYLSLTMNIDLACNSSLMLSETFMKLVSWSHV